MLIKNFLYVFVFACFHCGVHTIHNSKRYCKRCSWYFNANQRETLDQTFSAKTVTDLSLSCQIVPQLSLTVGANNLFDVYRDMHTHSGNQSTGRFVYSRRVQQMGFNGAYYFGRLKLNLPTQ